MSIFGPKGHPLGASGTSTRLLNVRQDASGILTLDLTTMGTFVAAADAADLLTCLNLYLDQWVPFRDPL